MNKDVITHLLRMTIPGRQDRRSVHIRDQAEKFASGLKSEHYSPSGMTAIIFAEAALQEGKTVQLTIHPKFGVIINLIEDKRFPSA